MLLGVMDTSASADAAVAALSMQRSQSWCSSGRAPASSRRSRSVASGWRRSSCRCSRALYPGSVASPSAAGTGRVLRTAAGSRSEALRELLRGRLQASGPASAATLASALALPRARSRRGAVRARERRLRAARPVHAGACRRAGTEWCERRLLARIHRYTIKSLRAEIEPVASADFMRFLLDWQGVTRAAAAGGRRRAWRASSSSWKVSRLPAIAWESDVLPARLQEYDGGWLDSLCLSGRAFWARLDPPDSATAGTGARDADGVADAQESGVVAAVCRLRAGSRRSCRPVRRPWPSYLQRHGASFFDEIVQGAGLLPAQAESALAELVAAGGVSADSFGGLRALLLPMQRKRKPARAADARRLFGLEEAGRWSLVRRTDRGAAPERGTSRAVAGDRHAETQARRSRRWRGCCCAATAWCSGACWRARRHGCRHGTSCCALIGGSRRRAMIRGGRFVAGVSGEQYALPEAVGALRAVRKRARDGAWVSLERCRSAEPCRHRDSRCAIGGAGRQSPAVAGWRDGGELQRR